MATTSVNFQQLAAAYIVANDPNQVRQILVANGLVADIATANALSDKQLVDILVSYYNTNGNQAYLQLLRQFVPNTSTSNWTNDASIMQPFKDEVYATIPAAVAVKNSQARTFSSDDWWTPFLDVITGGSTSTTAPTVTTTTKASGVTIGLIIAGVAILAIIAWVIIKK